MGARDAADLRGRHPAAAVTALLLFIPVAVFAPKLYLWAQPEAVSGDEILKFKAPYLNVTVLARSARSVYFAFWWFCSMLLNKWSAAQDRGELGVTEADTRRFRVVSAPGLVFFILLMSLAAVDWLMSLDPHWYSTIYGLILVVGQALSALAFAVAVLALLAPREPMNRVLRTMHFHDLGKLMLALVMLWAYFSFSQFLIIWAGNLPEEIPYYLERLRRRLEVPEPGPGHRPLRPALLPAAVGRPEEAAEAAGARRVVHRRDPALRRHLARRAPASTEGAFPISLANVGIPLALAGAWVFLFAGQLRKHAAAAGQRPVLQADAGATAPWGALRCRRTIRTGPPTIPDVVHEESDINVRAIIWFVVVLTGIIAGGRRRDVGDVQGARLLRGEERSGR